LWQNFGKIQSFGPKFSQNFPGNIDEIVGAATLLSHKNIQSGMQVLEPEIVREKRKDISLPTVP